jgi:hypothetical protein
MEYDAQELSAAAKRDRALLHHLAYDAVDFLSDRRISTRTLVASSAFFGMIHVSVLKTIELSII